MRFAEYPRSPDPSPISGLVVEKKKQTATPLSRGSNLEAWLLRFIYPPCRFSEVAGELIPPPALAKPASHKLMAAQVGRSVSYNEHKPRKPPPTCLAATRENSVHLEFYVAGPGLCEYEKLQCEMSDLQLKYYELLATRKVTLKEVFMRNHAAPCFTVSIQGSNHSRRQTAVLGRMPSSK